MRKIAILIPLFWLLSCSKNKEFELPSGTRLVSIEYMTDNNSWTEKFTYSSNNELIKIEDIGSLDRRYKIVHQNSQLKEIETYSNDGKLLFRDSIIYNSNGTIRAIHNFSDNSSGNLSLTWIYEFEYSNENKVSKKISYLVESQKYTSIEKFYWGAKNIERVEYYNGVGKLNYEYFYQYDDKINYQKGKALGILSPINWSENNLVEMNWNDYLGNIDLTCRPCSIEYSYNLDNYPILKETNFGLTVKLEYE